MIQNSFVAFASDPSLANADYGIPLYWSSNADPTGVFTCTQYCDQGKTFQFHAPSGMTPAAGSDHHLAIINRDTGEELDMWEASGSGTSWSASTVVKTDAGTGSGAICEPGSHCTGANAASFALMAGVIRPEELASGNIDHALEINTPQPRAGYIACPATHTDGGSFGQPGNNYAPEGAHLQLDPSIDVASQPWLPWQKTIAVALQRYGAFVGDHAGAVTLRGQVTGDWAASGAGKDPSLNWIPWTKMRILTMTQC